MKNYISELMKPFMTILFEKKMTLKILDHTNNSEQPFTEIAS
jgi:hypothetical protein